VLRTTLKTERLGMTCGRGKLVGKGHLRLVIPALRLATHLAKNVSP
jgi:hypothetical protein